MSKVIVYVNSSHENLRYVREAEKSALSFKEYFPDAKFLLFTDAADYASTVFDELHPVSFDIPPDLEGSDHKNGQMVAKLKALATLDFDQAIYLGSDTYAMDSLAACLFTLLDKFDIAAAHAPCRINTSSGVQADELLAIPNCFPEFNCDVVVFKNTGPVRSFLESWRDLYVGNVLKHDHDQGAFRYLAWNSDLRIATLPPEFNYRGDAYRKDTVILQNRAVLDKHIEQRNDGRHPRSMLRRFKDRWSRIFK